MANSAWSSVTVLVVGSLNWDFIGRSKEHSSQHQHMIFDNDSVMTRPGGHGANQAVAVYRGSHVQPGGTDHTASLAIRRMSRSSVVDLLDVNVQILGMIGDADTHGDNIIKALKKNGVDTSQVSVAKNVQTGWAHIGIDGEGIPKIWSWPFANNNLTPDMIRNWTPTPAMVLVQLEIPIETVRKVIRQAKQQNIPIIFNPAPYRDSLDLGGDDEIFNVDHVVVNADCATRILGLPEQNENQDSEREDRFETEVRYMRACSAFHDRGADCVVITLGAQGVVASYLEPEDERGGRNRKVWIFGAKTGPEDVIDQTGASDAFIGVYAVEILRQLRSDTFSGSLDIGAALELGLRAGGLTVSNMGSMDSFPWRDEILGRAFVAAEPFVRENFK